MSNLTPSSTSIGFIALVGAAVLIASGSVFIGAYSATVSPTIIAFIGFSGAAIVAWMIPSGSRPPLFRHDLLLFVGANVTTVGVFVSFYHALALAEPALVSAAQAGSSPLFAVVAALLVPQLLLPRGWIAAASLMLVLVAVILTVLVAVTELSGLEMLNSRSAILGMMLAIVSGASTYLLTMLLQALGKRGWSTVQLIRTRFLLIILVTGWLTLSLPDGVSELVFILTTSLLPLCLAFVALPMFLIQMSVLRLPVLTVLMGINAVPVLTFVIQFADGRIEPSAWSLVATVLTTIGVVIYITTTQASKQP